MIDGQPVGEVSLRVLAAIEQEYGPDAEIGQVLIVVEARGHIEDDPDSEIAGVFVDCTSDLQYVKKGLLVDALDNVRGGGIPIDDPGSPD